MLRLALLLSLLFVSISLSAQTTIPVRNYIEVLRRIEWNTTSGSWRNEYERFLYTNQRLAIGIKGVYVAKYTYGNFQIISSSSCCETASHALITGTASFYPGNDTDFLGFFFHGGLGAGLTQYKYKGQSTIERTVIKPTIEFGPGLQFGIGTSLSLRFKATAAFGPFKGGFTSTGVSLGF